MRDQSFFKRLVPICLRRWYDYMAKIVAFKIMFIYIAAIIRRLKVGFGFNSNGFFNKAPFASNLIKIN